MMVEAPDGSNAVKIEGHREYIWGAAFSPDGRQLASRDNEGRNQVGGRIHEVRISEEFDTRH
jgi:WD40 repeat protein